MEWHCRSATIVSAAPCGRSKDLYENRSKCAPTIHIMPHRRQAQMASTQAIAPWVVVGINRQANALDMARVETGMTSSPDEQNQRGLFPLRPANSGPVTDYQIECDGRDGWLGASQSVVSPESAGDRFASELVEMPVGYAAVHELREANDVRPVLEASCEEILHVDGSHRPQ